MIHFEPVYQSKVWGGRRFEEFLGRQLPPGPIGESWELVDLPEHTSKVPSGPMQGLSLDHLWREGMLNHTPTGDFPFLLKWLDVHAPLSLQVHPDEQACKVLGSGHPKSEAWYVAHAEPGAKIHIGHKKGFTSAVATNAIAEGRIIDWVTKIEPRIGDMYLVSPGTLHAIDEGLILLEVQQPSDTTYRVYDWERKGLNGAPRQLHVQEALACINYNGHGAPHPSRGQVVGPGFSMQLVQPPATIAPDKLRVFVGIHSNTRVANRNESFLLPRGTVLVGEVADGDIQVRDLPCLVLSQTPLRIKTPSQ